MTYICFLYKLHAAEADFSTGLIVGCLFRKYYTAYLTVNAATVTGGWLLTHATH
jgi:hypothetical protein